MKNKLSQSAAKGITTALNAFLRIDANSTSCLITYQPKAPTELAKFRKKK